MYVKTAELSRRIREAEKDVERLVKEELSLANDRAKRSNAPSSSSSINGDPESQHPPSTDPHAQDAGSDDDLTDDEGESDAESFDALEDRFHGLEEEVAVLVADVHDLALYTKLNITGFMKILKVRVLFVN